MKNDISSIAIELAKELIKIKDDKSFVECILASVDKETDRKELLNFIINHPKEATVTEISLMAVDIHRKKK